MPWAVGTLAAAPRLAAQEGFSGKGAQEMGGFEEGLFVSA